MKIIRWGLCIAGISLMAIPSAQASQIAAAAPTKPVYTRNLDTPDVPSDTRNLESIIDKDQTVIDQMPVDEAQTNPPPTQTILVMPSAATGQVGAQVANPDAPAKQEPPAKNHWHRWTSDPTTVFVALISVFTFLLALAAGYQGYLARDGARRQLRAYLMVASASTSGFDKNGGFYAQLLIRNVGQTPAQNIRSVQTITCREFPIKGDLPLTTESQTAMNVGPGGEYTATLFGAPSWAAHDLDDIQRGVKAIYVVGEITYQDVFGKERVSQYVLMQRGEVAIAGGMMEPYGSGNVVL